MRPERARAIRVAGVILAAGSGTRFGGQKLVAELDGQPIIRHVVEVARAAGLEPIVVVEPPGDPFRAADLGDTERVVNPVPADGLSGSVRIGLRALDADASRPALDAALILPADQPLVRAEVIGALIAAAQTHPDVPFVVPHYSRDGSHNPVLARRSAWRLADELAGDRGFGPVLAAHPELILEVALDGGNPDVDTVEDLRRLTEPGVDGADVS